MRFVRKQYWQKGSGSDLRVIFHKVPAAGVTWDCRNCTSVEATELSQASKARSTSSVPASLSSDSQLLEALGTCSRFWRVLLPSLSAVCTDYYRNIHKFCWHTFIFYYFPHALAEHLALIITDILIANWYKLIISEDTAQPFGQRFTGILQEIFHKSGPLLKESSQIPH